tara:strand:- start:703 stop:2229 length:1527 start_codon:yes stop_codon:yes gene_type:complete
MNNKIVTINQLKQIRETCNKKKKKIVLVHGVFDVVHLGHIEHFKQAKEKGDILVISLTNDKFVKKGINKPYFKIDQRCKFLSSISIVDYITVSNLDSSIEVLKNLKPNFYCKGQDYIPKSGDKAGNLILEKKITEKFGGKLFFTSGQQFSSTKILNENFQDFNLAKDQMKKIFESQKEKDDILNEFYNFLKTFKDKKVLVIGEVIIDTYIYSSPLGTPSKETIISVNYEKKKTFLGGAIPVVKNISEINKQLTFVSLFKDIVVKKKIKKFLGKDINLKLFNQKDYKEVSKNRFINNSTNEKFFEYYDFNNKEYNNNGLEKYLQKNLKNFDRVIVCDFGHGLFNKKIVNTLIKESRFLCGNIQTNSGNRGFNLFTKYSKLDFLSIDEPEARLGLSEKNLDILKIMQDKRMKVYKNLMITRGISGLITRLSNSRKNKTIEFPALNVKATDTLGAGDAVYSYVSCLVNKECDPRLISIVGAIAGAIKTNILGHSSWVSINDVKKSIEAILK